MRSSINLKITLIILIALALESAILFWYESNSIRKDLTAETIRDARLSLTSFQSTLSFLARHNEGAQLQETVAALGSKRSR